MVREGHHHRRCWGIQLLNWDIPTSSTTDGMCNPVGSPTEEQALEGGAVMLVETRAERRGVCWEEEGTAVEG